MRIPRQQGAPAHLGYCANVHPGETLAEVRHAVRHYAAGVRSALGVEAMGLGLWLGRSVASELRTSGVGALRQDLAASGIEVVSLNGFPFGDFHAAVVKRRVYHPDLTSDARRQYLLDLARLLAELLPEDVQRGTISTVPIGHREEPIDGQGVGVVEGLARRADAEAHAASQLCTLALALSELREATGKVIVICLEPEPGCWLETTADAVAFFDGTLLRVARARGMPLELVRTHLALCYDTCHQALCFEDPVTSLHALQAAEVPIGKVQLSSALEVSKPAVKAAQEALAAFVEPRFLHQVKTLDAAGRLLGVDDLDESAHLPRERPWRVHFHVPIHREAVGLLGTTRPFLQAALAELRQLPVLPHVEVETYTWTVLPEAERPRSDADLIAGLAAELAFASGELRE